MIFHVSFFCVFLQSIDWAVKDKPNEVSGSSYEADWANQNVCQSRNRTILIGSNKGYVETHIRLVVCIQCVRAYTASCVYDQPHCIKALYNPNPSFPALITELS